MDNLLYINRFYDVTLAPAQPVCETKNNLTGSYGHTIDHCIQKNAIYRSNGDVCRKVILECAGVNGCITDTDKEKMDKFCGPTYTMGFYHDGAFWSYGQ